jgi:hypothetical protein
MDLKIPWKALSKQDAPTSKWGAFSSKWGAFSVKQIAFFAVVGLAVIAGIVLRFGQFGQPEAEQTAPVTVAAPAPPPPVAATPPSAAPMPPVQTTESQAKIPPPAQQPATPIEQSGQAGETADQAGPATGAADQADQTGSPGAGPILVSRQPVAMLASPSSSAPTLYGFPAGRPFRVIGHQAGFAQIKDLRSGATGWIDEAALAPPPNSPAVSTPSQPRPVTASGRPAAPSAAPPAKATKKDTQVTASPAESSDQLQTPKRPGLFGRGGLFGGIFGGGNGNANGNAN